MDGRRFDDLARGLAAARSRRSVLKGVVTALIGGLAGVPRRPAEASAASAVCEPKGYQDCFADAQTRLQICIDNCNSAFCRGADREPDVCLACQFNCQLVLRTDLQRCEEGGGCSAGQACCGSACTDLTADPANCGACGAACAANEVCSDGSCECAPGYGDCGDGVCRDPQTDQHFCGCYTDCGDCYICQDGSCTPNKTCPTGMVQDPTSCECVCSSDTTECGGQCIDTSTDAANCGGCGTACGQGETCSGGSCTSTCEPFSCPGDSSCCGAKCCLPNEICSFYNAPEGRCEPACPVGMTFCGNPGAPNAACTTGSCLTPRGGVCSC